MKPGASLTELLGIEFPIIMAPMFLVSNLAMLTAGMQSGIMAVFPSLNYRNKGELEDVLDSLSALRSQLSALPVGSYGVNLITQKTNPYFTKHLRLCAEKKVPFYITSLGSPREVIEAARSYGAKVFCDVTNIAHARKSYEHGCDGFIAVGQGAGGHAGPNPLQVLIPALKKEFPAMPVIAAGGIATGQGLLSVKVLGADGASIGTRFIASAECGVNQAYKQAITDAGMDDIVMTTKLSGTPCTIINTPEAQKMGYTQGWFEKFLSRNKRTRKWFKMALQVRGMKRLEESVLPNNYKKLWCAGKSVELINDIAPCSEIITQIKEEYFNSIKQLMKYSP